MNRMTPRIVEFMIGHQKHGFIQQLSCQDPQFPARRFIPQFVEQCSVVRGGVDWEEKT